MEARAPRRHGRQVRKATQAEAARAEGAQEESRSPLGARRRRGRWDAGRRGGDALGVLMIIFNVPYMV